LRVLFWIFAVLLGLACAAVRYYLPDPTMSALPACAVAMLLAVIRPEKPWRWGLLLAVLVPMSDLYSWLAHEFVQSGRVEGSIIIGLASGFVGGYGGSIMRRMSVNVFNTKS
jgi:uncharacterized membrane protein YfcA